jgi:insulysin
VKRVGEIEFDFLDKSKPLNYTIRLASKMQLFYEPEKLADIIRHQYIVEKFDPEMIQQMSNLLTDPKNVNIYIRSKSFDKPELTPIEDKWYKTKYGKEPFNPALLNKILHPEVKQGRKVLDLPPKNNLLPKNLDVLPGEAESSQKPFLLRQWADDTDLWFMKDDKYQRPKGLVSLKIYTGDCEFGQTARGRVFVEMWNSILNEYLREFYYMAQMASLNASVSLPHDNVNIQWSGFSDSLPTFVEETLKRIKGLKVHEMPDTFAQVKEKLMQNWFNFYLEQAYQQAYFTFDNIMLTTAFEKKQLRSILESLTFEEFCKQSEEWL